MKAALALLVLIAAAPAVADDDHGFSKGERFGEATGEALYRSICRDCHMPDARGARGAGTYPSLAGNARLAGAAYPVLVVLNGRRNMRHSPRRSTMPRSPPSSTTSARTSATRLRTT